MGRKNAVASGPNCVWEGIKVESIRQEGHQVTKPRSHCHALSRCPQVEGCEACAGSDGRSLSFGAKLNESEIAWKLLQIIGVFVGVAGQALPGSGGAVTVGVAVGELIAAFGEVEVELGGFAAGWVAVGEHLPGDDPAFV